MCRSTGRRSSSPRTCSSPSRARTADLRNAFPHVPFLAFLGWTPLVVWFSRITEIGYYDAHARRQREQDATGIYRELNVMALLRRRALFVPAIYATEQRTVAIARHCYGMPKLVGLPQASFVRARVVPIRLPVPRLRGRRSWPVHFPSGSAVQVLLHGAAHMKLAWLACGQLSLATAWLPRPRSFLPLAVHCDTPADRVTDARLRLHAERSVLTDMRAMARAPLSSFRPRTSCGALRRYCESPFSRRTPSNRRARVPFLCRQSLSINEHIACAGLALGGRNPPISVARPPCEQGAKALSYRLICVLDYRTFASAAAVKPRLRVD